MRIRLILPLLCVLLGLWTSCFEGAQNTKEIIQEVQDRNLVAKVDQLLVTSEATFSNISVATASLNSRLPDTVSKLNLTLDNASKLMVTYEKSGKDIVAAFQQTAQAAQALQQSSVPVMSNLAVTATTLNQQIPTTVSTLNFSIQHLDTLITNLNHSVVTFNRVTKGQDANGQQTWWAKGLADFVRPLLTALKYGAMLLVVILGRMLWVATKSVDNVVPPDTKTGIGEDQRKLAPWSQLLLSRWLKVQRKLRSKS